MAQAMTERCYRTESLPQGIGVCRRALTRRRRCAAAHLSDTAPPCHLSSRRGFGVRCVRGQARLKGSLWMGVLCLRRLAGG